MANMCQNLLTVRHVSDEIGILLDALAASDFILSDRFDYKTEDNCAYFKFDTKWEPPIRDIDKIACVFPHLDVLLEYCEPGMRFKGRVGWHKGKPLINIHEEFEGDSIEAWEAWDKPIDNVLDSCNNLKGDLK